MATLVTIITMIAMAFVVFMAMVAWPGLRADWRMYRAIRQLEKRRL